MNLGLDNKTALVSASSGGIGLEIALSLAKENATVVINGRTEKSVTDAIAAIKQQLPDAKLQSLIADIGTKEGAEKAIQEVPDVDILVNNLGIYEAVGFFEETDEAWFKLFEVNIMSGVRLSRHYAKKMIERGTGRVIFISSESAINPAPEMAHYSATKTMQLAISRSLAELTKGTKVTVNAVLPGPTKTEGVGKFIQNIFPQLSAEEAEKAFVVENRPTSLIQRLINPSEIGDFVAFVAIEKASAINGAALRVDGGVVKSAF